MGSVAARHTVLKTPVPFWGMYFEAEEAGAVVNITKVGSPVGVAWETSVDGTQTWQPFDADTGSTPITLKHVGDRVYFRTPEGRTNGRISQSTTAYRCFTLSKKCKAGGDIASLRNPTRIRNTSGLGMFCRLFYNCTNLTESPKLSNLYLSNNAYRELFYGCSSLRLIDVDCYTPGQAMCTDWVRGVPATGIFRCMELYGDDAHIQRGYNACPAGWTVETKQHKFAMFCSGTLYSSSYAANRLKYSTDGGETWNNFPSQSTVSASYRVIFVAAKTPQTSVAGTSSGVFTYYKSSTQYSSKIKCAGGDLRALLSEDCEVSEYGDCAYAGLFAYCSDLNVVNCRGWLTSIPNYAYSSLFRGCSSLTYVPFELPFTELANQCYSYMFSGTGISTPPSLPAATLARYCYSGMFSNCTALTTAPVLRAQTLATGCYRSMFAGCSALLTAPELPATTLYDYSYYSMFSGCSSLTDIPVLPALDVLTESYSLMFDGCTGLTTIDGNRIKATSVGSYGFAHMFRGCSSITTVSWTLPSELNTSSGSSWSRQFSEMFANCSALVTPPQLPATEFLGEGCCNKMFAGCTSLTTPPLLPATTFGFEFGGYGVYEEMFSGCTSLTSAPALPATTLAEKCYKNMFSGCTSLTSVNTLPATTLGVSCYEGMFSGCTALTSTPSLPATTLAGSCYRGMFTGCTSLTSVTTFPATTLADRCCEEMFKDCTALTCSPALPATYFATRCYSSMFEGCTHLVSAGEISANSDESSGYGCYQMFAGCVSLRFAPRFRISYLKPPAGNWWSAGNYCCQRMFDGCTSLVWAPSLAPLPWKLYNGSYVRPTGTYHRMFSNCTSLVVAPKCPEGTGTNETFNGCTSLSDVLLDDVNWEDKTNWLEGVSATGTFRCPAALGTNETIARGVSRCPEGWTVDNNMYSWCLNFEAEEANCVIGINTEQGGNSPLADVSLVCSTDNGATWTDFFITGSTYNPVTLANIGDKVYIRAKTTNSTFVANDSYIWFTTSKKCKCAGNIMSLLDGEDRNLPFIDTPNALAWVLTETLITTAPELPALRLSEGCYQGLFWGCSELVSPPSLPATELAPFCYEDMFEECASLTSAPSLPATALANGCYRFMFMNCSSLTSAPELPATTPVANCYQYMFNGCHNLSSITVGLKTFGTNINATNNWLNGVAASGSFTCSSMLGSNSTIERGGSYCPNGWTVTNPDWWLAFEAVNNGTTSISMSKMGTPPTVSLEYSKDGSEWSEFNADTPTTVSLSKGEWVYFRAGSGGNTTLASSDSAYRNFTFDNDVRAHGNVMSLLNGDVPTTSIAEGTTYALARLFMGATNLLTTPELPATGLTQYCYYGLFQGCTSLANSAPLPSNSVLAPGCYAYMYSGCTALTSAPALPFTTLASYCYRRMFEGCTALTTAPTLPATSLNGLNYVYDYMFYGCSSLTTPPALPATNLSKGCYRRMFCDCTSLTSAPALPATDLTGFMNAYAYMFCDCTALTTAPALPATALANQCYRSMFDGCSALTTPPPTLPATNANYTYVYNRMFYGCTSLTASPVIENTSNISTSLAWQFMFQGCSSLSSIEVKMTAFGSGMANWVDGVASTGTFRCPAALGTNETISRGTNACPTGWTVVNPT